MSFMESMTKLDETIEIQSSAAPITLQICPGCSILACFGALESGQGCPGASRRLATSELQKHNCLGLPFGHAFGMHVVVPQTVSAVGVMAVYLLH